MCDPLSPLPKSPCVHLYQVTKFGTTEFGVSTLYDFLLSWTTGSSGRLVGGKLRRPSWGDVEQHLEAAARTGCGTVILDIVNADEVGPQSLQVHCKCGMFDVTLGETTTDDHDVRVLNPAYAISTSRIPSTDWFPTNSLSEDFSLIRRILREFFETGNVSRELLS